MDPVKRRAGQVQNKTPAPVQITAEQILLKTKERQEKEPAPPAQKITDVDELNDFRLRKRKQFEDRVRQQRYNINVWLKYAAFEESQHDFRRARSVFERTLDVDPRNPTVYIKYAEMETRYKHFNHARNIFTLTSRYKYTFFEEMLGNIPAARQIFDRWMGWKPDTPAWIAFVKLEMRYHEHERARQILERFIQCHPVLPSYLKYAKFLEKNLHDIEGARAIYQRAYAELGLTFANTDQYYCAFAQFEERRSRFPVERARTLYRFALEHLPRTQAPRLYAMFAQFEKQHGDRAAIEDVIVSKRRFQYEQLKADKCNYDVWFDYARLEESQGNPEHIREVYQRAISCVPPEEDKRLWRRYIYLWINFAMYEELEAKDDARAERIYQLCIDNVIPHTKFTFAKMWVLYSQFLVRQKKLPEARALLGRAIRTCPKHRIFRHAIELETQLGAVNACRQLHQRYIMWAPTASAAWVRFAEFETDLGEVDRARAIYDMAANQAAMDVPEAIWKAYIDMEIAQANPEGVRAIYERLLGRAGTVKVWVSYALFETDNDPALARAVFERGYKTIPKDMPDERATLLDSWRDFEERYGTPRPRPQSKLPTRQKKQRPIVGPDGQVQGWEEYIAYTFPEDAAQARSKMLAKAKAWKLKQQQQQRRLTEGGSGEEPQEEIDTETGAASTEGRRRRRLGLGMSLTC
ncbi:putative Protein crooked neck [Paratrimastix pyriformis]|uniref:Uncharacterized protein n=1 Tax=Paratrimastix pyriformis TaxID=342808 RepID=A0ABQ8U3E5_9EUKA|nr:putative Protein crooked neck [Paratrimastix pyriformis]